MSALFLLAAGNDSSDLGRAQYHLEALHDDAQKFLRYCDRKVGHTISEVEKWHYLIVLFRKMPKTINGVQNSTYLSACLTSCSRMLNELRFDIYFDWSSFTRNPLSRIMVNSLRLRLDSEEEILLLLKIHWHVFILDQLIRRNMIDLYHFAYISSHSSSLTLPHEVTVIHIDEFDIVDDEQHNTAARLLIYPRWILTRIEFETFRRMRIRRLLESARQYQEIERTLFAAFYAAVLNSESDSQFSYIHVGVDKALALSRLLNVTNPDESRVQLQLFTFQSFVNDGEVRLTKLESSKLFLFFYSSSK